MSVSFVNGSFSGRNSVYSAQAYGPESLGITTEAQVLPCLHGMLVGVDVGRSTYTVKEPKDGAC